MGFTGCSRSKSKSGCKAKWKTEHYSRGSPQVKYCRTEVPSLGLLPPAILAALAGLTSPSPELPRLPAHCYGAALPARIPAEPPQHLQASIGTERSRTPASHEPHTAPCCPSTVHGTSWKRFHQQPVRSTGCRSSPCSAAEHRRCFEGGEWAPVPGRSKRLSLRVTLSAHHESWQPKRPDAPGRRGSHQQGDAKNRSAAAGSSQRETAPLRFLMLKAKERGLLAMQPAASWLLLLFYFAKTLEYIRAKHEWLLLKLSLLIVKMKFLGICTQQHLSFSQRTEPQKGFFNPV